MGGVRKHNQCVTEKNTNLTADDPACKLLFYPPTGSWQNANNPAKLAEDACSIGGGQVIAFNTNGYIKTALRQRSHWTKVEAWADKPCNGIYVHNSVLWKLLLA